MTSEQNKSPPNSKILERLKKLFALGQSSNQHEAELAMQKASELMAEHQIGMAQIDLHDDGDITKEEHFLPEGARMANWVLRLATACAVLYDAQCHRVIARGGVKLRFYGTPTDISLAKATFDHLYGSWKAIVAHDLKKAKADAGVFGVQKSFRASHLVGYASAILARAKDLAKARQATVESATGRDLVLVKNAALDAFMQGVKARAATSSARICSAGFAAGKERGDSIPLGGSIGGDQPLAIAHRARG